MRILAGVLLAGVLGSAQAGEPVTWFDAPCSVWLAVRQLPQGDPGRVGAEQWMTGFYTGFALGAQATGWAFPPETDKRNQVYLIDAECSGRTDDLFGRVLTEFILKSHPPPKR